MRAGPETFIASEEVISDERGLFFGELALVFDGEVSRAAVRADRPRIWIDASVRAGIHAAAAAAAAVPGEGRVRRELKIRQDLAEK